MFLVRQSKPEDAGALQKLARTVFFINLPPQEHLIAAKIRHSEKCFRRLAGIAEPSPKRTVRATKRPKAIGGMAQHEEDSDLFMFTIDAPHGAGVIGTSQVRAHMGGPGNPNWRLAISEKKFHSESLRFGTTHTVARLDGDETGPSEVGGLILDPGFRGHPDRPGRLLSFTRFHYMALHRAAFADVVLAEMMGPVTSDGESAFWDAFGRKFIPVKFAEADRFCQHNRAFISDLLPKEEIYLTLMPLEVINLVGVVGKDTLPARRMLEGIGFRYRGFVDPFDGGPHLDCPTDEISLVRATRRVELAKPTNSERYNDRAIVSCTSSEGEFRATECPVELRASGPVRLPQEAMELIGATAGMSIGVTPLRRILESTRSRSEARDSVGNGRLHASAAMQAGIAAAKPKGKARRRART